jgi:hypothetical protein
VIALVSALLTVTTVAAEAAKRPPRVSQVRVVERAPHQLAIQFAVPAAYYRPGAGVVVRLTRGRTPAARPAAGYHVPVTPRHRAQAGPFPELESNTAYTFAIWIRASGRYSRRVVVRTRTAVNVHPPADIGNVRIRASVDPSPRVVISWGELGADVRSVRIVRNTEMTTAGGTVFTLAGRPTSFTDANLPRIIDDPGGSPRFSAAPIHYWLIARDKAGRFSILYHRTSVVVGSRIISGQVSGTDRFVHVYCCPGATGELNAVTGQGGLGEDVNGGAFSVRVPPGVYTICEGDNSAADVDPTATCWTDDPGPGGHTTPWGGHDEQVPTETIDLRTATSYDEVDFTRE